MEKDRALRLYKKSVLKQRKFREIISLTGNIRQDRCLDLGSDDGVVSYLLRSHGGRWSSAVLTRKAVEAARRLVGEVHKTDGYSLPFPDDTFGLVVIVDMLEHVADDRRLIEEIYRVMKPGSHLIVNVPHLKRSLLRKLRILIGLTDERHGHVRTGYTVAQLRDIMMPRFQLQTFRTYSKFFSEIVDTLINACTALLKRTKGKRSEGAPVVTQTDLMENRPAYMVYTLVYPFIWAFSKLDGLLFFLSGYMLIVKAPIKK